MALNERVVSAIKEQFPSLDIRCEHDFRDIVTLTGECETWRQLIDVGHAAAHVEGVRNVVSHMTVKGLVIPKKDYSETIRKGKEIGVIAKTDVLIVGLGITGCGIARELAKYNLKIMAIDMRDDVGAGASKANNGGVHMAGLVKPGTLKAKLSVRGNFLYDKWAQELNFAFIRPGHLNYITSIDHLPSIVKIFETAVRNHDRDVSMLDGPQTLKIAPGIKDVMGDDPVASVLTPTQGKVHPYEVCVALAENAVDNGVEILLSCELGDVITENGQIKGVITEKGIIETKYLINAAGLYADEVSVMAGDECFTLHNRKGTIAIYDKSKPPATVQLAMRERPELKKDVESKGGGTDQTPSGNILMGPSATEVPDKEDIDTTEQDLAYTLNRNDNPTITPADVIRIYAGARPADLKEDYVIGMSELTHGLINAAAIQSPGIGSAPGVAEMVEGILLEDLEKNGTPAQRRDDWNPIREKKVKFAELSREEQAALIEKNPAYGHVICRCETITEGEILDAIHSPIVPTSIDAIKRRTRAGMGRCQGGFCQPRVLEILARELGKEWVEINLKGRDSTVLKQKNR
ncbi:MAG: FAD-dependent oxidoreductase [Lachnospiraceae bacterium]|nr:FAD-dependent oxidoreductase [Lachnospiraceae bacterium]